MSIFVRSADLRSISRSSLRRPRFGSRFRQSSVAAMLESLRIQVTSSGQDVALRISLPPVRQSSAYGDSLRKLRPYCQRSRSDRRIPLDSRIPCHQASGPWRHGRSFSCRRRESQTPRRGEGHLTSQRHGVGNAREVRPRGPRNGKRRASERGPRLCLWSHRRQAVSRDGVCRRRFSRCIVDLERPAGANGRIENDPADCRRA